MLSYPATSKGIDLGDEAVEELAVVGNHNDGAVEGGDGLLQHILGLEVEVVGGFVKDKEVDRLEQELNHGQATALAAREHFHFLVNGVATEHEGSEDVADAGADVAGGHAVDGVKDGEFRVKKLCLVLCEVADLCIMPHLQVALEGDFPEDALDEGGFAFAVAPHKGHLLAAADGEVDVGDHLMLSPRIRGTPDRISAGGVCFAEVFDDEGKIAAALARRELEVK